MSTWRRCVEASLRSLAVQPAPARHHWAAFNISRTFGLFSNTSLFHLLRKKSPHSFLTPTLIPQLWMFSLIRALHHGSWCHDIRWCDPDILQISFDCMLVRVWGRRSGFTSLKSVFFVMFFSFSVEWTQTDVVMKPTSCSCCTCWSLRTHEI